MPAPDGAPQAATAAAGGAAVLLPLGRAPRRGRQRWGSSRSCPVPTGSRGWPRCVAPPRSRTSAPRGASRPRPILPPVCRGFPVSGAACPESVPCGRVAEACGGLDKRESRLPGFVWDLRGSRWGKRDTMVLVSRSSPSPPRWWQGAGSAPAVRRAQLPAWLQCAACSSGAGKSPSHAIVRLLFDSSDS